WSGPGRRPRPWGRLGPGIHGDSAGSSPGIDGCSPGVARIGRWSPHRMRRGQSMGEAYRSDLRYLGDDLVDVASMVRATVGGATTALLESDLGLAERVIAADTHIDERQVDLDSKIVELLARQSPVATDLRLMVAALRMSSSLERMGDLSAHI